MITRLPVLGGWYADAWPSGEWCAAVPGESAIHTHLGPIVYPQKDGRFEPLVWIACAPGSPFLLAGQSQVAVRGWAWTGSAWEAIPPPCGTWSSIYAQTRQRFLSDCGPGVGSQGYRWVDPRTNLPVPSDSVIAPLNGLAEWTDLSPAQDRSLLVGQDEQGRGAGVWEAGILRLLEPGPTMAIRGKYDAGLDRVAIALYLATTPSQSVLWWGSLADLRGLPVLTSTPPVTFSFSHPVSVYPFKAEGSGLPDLFTLGPYSEEPIPPVVRDDQRLLLAHDGQQDWVVPVARLRDWDLCLIECYLVQGESFDESAARWERQARSLLAQWPGDCGLIPQFYCQGGAPPNELWPVEAVCDGLRRLSAVANLDPRLKILAPFAYDRANGVVAHPELQQALNAMAQEAARVGAAGLAPINPEPPEPPDPPDPPIPPIPPHPGSPFHHHRKAASMDLTGKTVVLRGPGGKLGRPDAPNTGIWASLNQGWRGVIWDGTDPSDARYHHTIAPVENTNYAITGPTGGLFGADATKFSTGLDKQFYYKPDGNTDRGGYETIRIYDGNENGALQGQVDYSDDSGKYSASVAVEVVG